MCIECDKRSLQNKGSEAVEQLLALIDRVNATLPQADGQIDIGGVYFEVTAMYERKTPVGGMKTGEAIASFKLNDAVEISTPM